MVPQKSIIAIYLCFRVKKRDDGKQRKYLNGREFCDTNFELEILADV